MLSLFPTQGHENFQENLKAWESELLLVSSLVLYKRLHTWRDLQVIK